ncbi:MAG: carbon-nitrogen hydrolase family protein [Rhodobacteraceae bacterium]|jgi:predicted amidohydrolase|nr:carbon-nitrogen hydrolase family protein [Paracoccaceae bacterium]
MSRFAIAGIQMHIGMGDNFADMRRRVELLMYLYPWVEMAVFSELTAHGPNHAMAEEMDGKFETECRELARKHKLWLMPGSYFEKRDGNIYNTAPVINPEGEIVTRYRKMFPFTPYEQGVTPGTEFCVFDVPEVGRFGLSICYDMWFPELTRTLVDMGAEVILNPVLASFVDRPSDLAIVQASAAMFQSVIFSINGLYAGGNGYSLVVDSTGRILHRGNVQEELIPLEVDFDSIRHQRRQGILNMGQPLKSFRDRPVQFPVYAEGHRSEYLDSLGPLVKAERPSRSGSK